MNRRRFKDFLVSYPRLGVVGTFWGDEGKGKIVDICGEWFDIVVRFGGGNNAGHSVKNGNKNFAFHMLPSGFARGQTCVLSSGVLFNLQAFVDEIAENAPKLSCAAPDVLVDERCPLWTPYHTLFEAYIEGLRKKDAIGTTGRAMGPLKGFYDMREGPLVAHLRSEQQLIGVLEKFYTILEPCLSKTTAKIPAPVSVAKQLIELAQSSTMLPRIIDTRAHLFEAITKHNKRILFEGSQAAGLSVEAGTWPYTTSTSAIAGGIMTGTLLPPRALSGVLLTMKLFPTRVGGGCMPGELSTRKMIQCFADDRQELFKDESIRTAFLRKRLQRCNSGSSSNTELGEYIMVKARELGVSTGRGRSPGRPDLAWARYAVQINDPFGCALNCLDIASGLQKIEVVAGYRYKGEALLPGKVPALDLENVEPIIQEWPGWEEDITGITDMSKLPKQAQDFIERFEEELGCPIVLIGTGSRRCDVIFRPLTGRFRTFF